MCGRYVSATPIEEVAEYFAAEPDPDLGEVARPRYNVPPTEQVLGVVLEAARAGPDPGEATAPVRRIRAYRWGLVPHWAKDLAAGNRAFNARAETLSTRPAYRAAFRERRLLVPATAFYEWQRAAGHRQPFAFRRSDGAPLGFAGLWERWKDPASGHWLRSLTIVTTVAGPDVEAVHDRQPAVLDPADFVAWLDPRRTDTAPLQHLLVPSPAGTLVATAVGTAVGSTANDSPHLLDPLGS
ncbi:MAG TPA: SOS response-associated peptidase [Acidimicrobiales bacterium]|nr:SOS response-associated peptidase [Acidimicrobiales bacterium]